MKKLPLLILLALAPTAMAEHRTLYIIDKNTDEYVEVIPLPHNVDIITSRADDTTEVTILTYRDGILQQLRTHRPNGTVEAQIDYTNGKITSISAGSPQPTDTKGELIPEKQISYQNGYPICK